jgi:hypothetical protein
VFNTHVSYSEGPEYKSRPGDRLFRLRFFVVFLSPSYTMSGYYLKIRPRTLPSESFPLHHSLIIYHSALYTLLLEKASRNKLQAEIIKQIHAFAKEQRSVHNLGVSDTLEGTYPLSSPCLESNYRSFSA